jgi:hypothetical protein
VFKDFQKKWNAFINWLEDNEKRLAESDWDNLYLPSIFWIFLRERVTAFIRICGKNNLLDYQLLKLMYLIYKSDAIYKLTVKDDFRISGN